MKKTLFRLSSISLALILCACGSSVPQESETSTAEEETETAAAETQAVTSESDYISFDSFSIEAAETENEYGVKRVALTLTNNSLYTIIDPKIRVVLREGVSAADLQEHMPEGFEVDSERLGNIGSVPLIEYEYYLNPGETSRELPLDVPNLGGDMTPYPMDELPYPQEIMDLLEIRELSAIMIVDGVAKNINLSPNMGGPDPNQSGLSAKALPPAINITLNQVPEEIKDKAVIPEGVSLYTCKTDSYNGSTYYRMTFYDMTEEAAQQCMNELKERYPEDPMDYASYYRGTDSSGTNASTEYYKKYQILREVID